MQASRFGIFAKTWAAFVNYAKEHVPFQQKLEWRETAQATPKPSHCDTALTAKSQTQYFDVGLAAAMVSSSIHLAAAACNAFWKAMPASSL
mmetsp:Transcript_60921/g.108198  ORF Transcript_60921/g.108198 Transcript_60921/m.108198 type:complete len:91 (-) Transcript_60921:886-1158(-)